MEEALRANAPIYDNVWIKPWQQSQLFFPFFSEPPAAVRKREKIATLRKEGDQIELARRRDN